MNYLKPQFDNNDVNQISQLGIAHIGDGVYELMTRVYLCSKGYKQVNDLHKLTVTRVNASAQAKAVDKIIGMLTEDELAVYKRGRNTRVNSVPHHSTVGEYHAATGLEVLFGWLYLNGSEERLNELFAVIVEEE